MITVLCVVSSFQLGLRVFPTSLPHSAPFALNSGTWEFTSSSVFLGLPLKEQAGAG